MDEQTYAGEATLIRQLAADAFSRHQLELAGEREWRCYRPRTGIYSFRVLVRPGAVLVWGDIGEGIFRGGEAGDTLAWLRDAVHSEDYLLGKLRTGVREFYPGDALQCAKEGAAEGSSGWEKLFSDAKRQHEHGELSGHTWAELVCTLTGDMDSCGVGWNYSSAALWLVEALKWLAAHLPPERETP